MAVPYPPDGTVRYSQDKDHRIARASRVIQNALDERPNWETLSERIAHDLRLSLDPPSDNFLRRVA